MASVFLTSYECFTRQAQLGQRDPINALTKHRVENEITDQTQFDELDRRAKQMALEAIQFADACPDPSLEKMYTVCTPSCLDRTRLRAASLVHLNRVGGRKGLSENLICCHCGAGVPPAPQECSDRA